MTRLVVDIDQLRAAIGRMDSFGRDVDECLGDIDQTMATLREAWHGDGSDAQARAQQQWQDGAEQMHAALAALQQAAEAAQQHYSDAVSTNGRMWQT
jgi:WXG100 family type VII secretion target